MNALEDFLAAYSRADAAGNARSPDLARFSTDQGLAWATKNVHDHAKLGIAHKGVWHFRSVGAVDVTKTSARVGQCMDWSPWPVVNRTTGAAFQSFAPWSELVHATVRLTETGWKVATIQTQPGAC